MTEKSSNITTDLNVLSDEHRFTSSTDPTVFLNLRERKPANPTSSVPLLLVHGATISSVLWDNPLPDWSLMNRLATDGFHVFAVDLRGYGRSSRPACFAQSPLECAPYAKADDVTQDLLDAIAFIQHHTGRHEIDVLGGSWGSIVCGKTLTENPATGARRLILYAPLYSEPAAKPAWLPDLHQPSEHGAVPSPIGAYRDVSIAAFRDRWDAEIPLQDKSLWRPDGAFEALTASCIADDAEYEWATSGSFRAPAGTISDLQDVYSGTPLYDCRVLSLPTMLLRGAADPVSTHKDASRLFENLGASKKQYTVIGNGAHFMVSENVFPQVHQVIKGFLSADY